MSKFCKLVFFMLLLAISSVSAAEDEYNVQDFEVFGVSLGDSANEVILALTDYFYISVDDLIIGTATSSETIEQIEFQNDEIEFWATLEPEHAKQTDPDKGNSNVLVKLLVGWKVYDFDRYSTKFDEFVVNYGSPSMLVDYGLLYWCEELNPMGRCMLGHDVLSLFSGPRNNPKMYGVLLQKDWRP